MLILNKIKEQQTINIGDHVKIQIKRIKGQYVKFAISAPDDIEIRRKERKKADE